MTSESPDTSAPPTRVATGSYFCQPPWTTVQLRNRVTMVSYGSSLIVVLRGEFDLANREHLSDAMDTVAERSERWVYVDASQLRFCDAAGFVLLAKAAVQLKRADRQVILLHCSPILDRMQNLIFSSEELASITIRSISAATPQRQHGP